MEIITSIHLFKISMPQNPFGMNNVYFIKTAAGNLLIDTGWNSDEAFQSLQEQMFEAGGKWEDLRWVVLTHSDMDHAGLLGRLAKVAQPELIIHPAELEQLTAERVESPAAVQAEMKEWLHKHGFENLPAMPFVFQEPAANKYRAGDLPERKVTGGETLEAGDFRLQMIHTPGHMPGHICVYEPENQLLFVGDHILVHMNPKINKYPPMDNPVGNYLESLRKVGELPVRLGLPGHGPLFTRVQERVEYLKAHHEERSAIVTGVLEKGAQNAYQVSQQIPWTDARLNFEQLPAFVRPIAVIEAVGHLEYLVRLGKASQREAGGQVLFELEK